MWCIYQDLQQKRAAFAELFPFFVNVYKIYRQFSQN